MKAKHASMYRRRAYLLDFLLALEAALASYFNATFMTSHGISEQNVGLVYSASFILGMCALIIMPRVLRRFGNARTFVYAALTGGVLAAALAFSESAPLIVGIFIAFSTVLLSLRFSLDIFLESSTMNASTGFTRAIYLTIGNTAFVLAPLLGGWLVSGDHFEFLYETTAALLLILTIGSYFAFRRFKDPLYDKIAWHAVFKRLFKEPDLRKIFLIDFLLLASYSLETIYVTVYLHEEIGFTLSQMGLIFAVSLLPFPLLQLPLGILGDRRWGEKEILTLGLCIMGIMISVLALVTSKDPATWAIILFILSIGWAMVEIASESYFFKRVDGRNIGLISAYRAMYPTAYIITPLVITFAMHTMPITRIFAYFGVLVLVLGIPTILMLRDTK